MLKLLILIIAALLFLGFAYENFDTAFGCTEEARICPDGSTVGRSGLQCEFDACSSE